MKVKYNETENSIEINDGLGKSYLAIKMVLTMNIFTALLNLFNMKDNGFAYIGYLWMVVGASSLGVLLYLNFKKTTLNKISLEKIDGLKEKVRFGTTRFSLKLKNGKSRDLAKLKTQSGNMELKNMFEKIGIDTIC